MKLPVKAPEVKKTGLDEEEESDDDDIGKKKASLVCRAVYSISNLLILNWFDYFLFSSMFDYRLYWNL